MIKILIQLSIVTMMLDVGLQLTIGEFRDSARRWKSLGVGLVQNVVIVPLVAYLVLSQTAETLQISTGVFATLILTSVSPGAPIGPKMVQIAKGDLAYASILMLVCQLVSIFSAPFSAQAMLPEGISESTGVASVILTLIGLLLVPMGIGLALRHRLGERANKLAKMAQLSTSMFFLATFIILITTRLDIFTSIRPIEYAYLLGITLIFGLVAIPSPLVTSKERISLVITSGGRNFALAMVLAAKGFGGHDALGATLVLGVLSTGTGFLISALIGRRRSR